MNADTSNITDVDGDLTFTYQWQLSSTTSFDSNSNIADATQASFTIPSDQSYVNKYIRLTAISTDSRGGTTEFQSAFQQIANVEDEAIGTLLINGIVQEGSILTADTSNITDVDGDLTFTYQWQLSSTTSFDSNSNIADATQASFTIPSDQSFVDKYIRLTAISSDSRGGTTEFQSAFQQIANVEDEAIGTLLINGIVQEGSILTADTSNITDVDGDLTFTYQWQLSSTTSFDSNSNIASATQASFTIPSDQSYVDKYIRLTAISTDSRGGITDFQSASQKIANVEDEAIGILLIDGIVEEGSTLNADTSNITDVDGDLTFTYQWQLSSTTSFDSNSNIADATQASFTIPSDQSYVDKYIRLTAISTDSRGGTTEFQSASQQIANVEDEAIGTLLINGIIEEGSTLNADTSNITDVDGDLTFTYQWQLSSTTSFDSNSNISGATQASFTIPSDQSYIDKYIRLTAISTDSRGGTTEFQSTSQQVSNVEDEAIGTLLIDGIVEEGSTLNANTSLISDIDGDLTFTYQWQLSSTTSFDSNSNIADATQASFTIPSDQSYVDKYIRLTVISTDSRGGTTEFQSASQLIANVEDEAIGTLLINGIVEEGSTLNADTSNITDVDGDLTFTYQWQLSSTTSFDSNNNISGATQASFTIPSDQSYIDKYIRLTAISTDSRGGTTEFQSVHQQVANIEDEATGILIIDGTVEEGSTLNANTSLISDVDGDLTFTYQWQLSNTTSFDSNSNIADATQASFTIPSDQSYVDKFIRLTAVSTDVRGGQTSFESSPQQISNIEDEATGTLLINGIVKEGSTLTADTSNISDVDGSLIFTFQWQLANTDSFDTNSNISGATNSTFTIPSDQTYVDKFIRLTAVSTDARGGITEFESSSQQVSNIEDEATGILSFDGIVQEGSTLTANTSDISDVDGSLTFTFQWQLADTDSFDNNSNISGATNSTFTIPSDQSYVDKFIRLTAVSTDARGGITEFETLSQQVINVDDQATGVLLFTGIVQEGSTLFANINNISDVDGSLTFTFQWQLADTDSFDSNSNISGANDSTFTIPSDQSYVDKFIRLTAISTDSRGGETFFETSSQVVLNVDDDAIGILPFNGLVQEGSTLTADISGITDVDGTLTFTFQWQLSNDNSNFINIDNAIQDLFIIPSDQSYVDKFIRLTAISTDSRGGTTSFESFSQLIANVDDKATGILSFSGTVQQGATLFADISDISDVDGSLTFTYQWQLSNTDSFDTNSNISEATNSTFTIPSDQSYVDKFIRLTAVSTDARGGTTTFETSSQQVSNIEDEAIGALLINGIVQEGATLTADTSNISDIDGSLTFTFQWQVADDSSSFDTNSNISGATNSTFTIPSDQLYVDKFIKLTAVSTDSRGGTTTFETSPQQVSNIEDEAIGTLLINGIVQEGATLTADTSNISDVDGSLTFTYQWQLSNDSSSFDTNSNISGATNSTFTIPSDQSYVDKFIKLTAVSTDARGGTTTFETSPQQVSNIEDEAIGTLLINGIVQEGETLTADTSNISDVDGSLTFTYQWQLSNDSSSFDTNSNIIGATNSTFTIPSDQSYVDKFIKLTVVSTDARGGTTTFETSPQQVSNIEDEAIGTLLINGIVKEGATLIADTSNISDVDGSLTFTYQWQLSNDSSSFDTNSNISGATNSTFTIPSDQSYVDKFIRLTAVSTDARGGTTTFETSPQQVSNIEDEATGTLLINGIVQEGATLTADITDISDVDGSLTFTYQWQLSNDSSSFDTNSNISGATNSTFTIPSDQSYVDKFIKLTAVSTDARGGTTTFETSPQQISNIEDEATGTLLINGIVQEGATLTANITDISDVDGSLTFTYQWQLSNDSSSFDTNSNISGATNSTFTIPSGQSYVDKFIKLTAVSTDARGGTTTFETSPQQVSNIEDEAIGTLLINGIVQEGSTLTADISEISDVDGSLTFTYQWQLSNDSSSFDTNSNISGATNSTFTIPSDQSYVDKFIKLTAVSTDARGGTTIFETSPQQVSNIEDEATGTLLINGIVQEGSILTADISEISDEDGSLTFTYQWQLSNDSSSFDTNSNISGATNSTFTIPSDQSYVDKFIKLTAVSTDARGGTTTFETSPQQVSNIEDEATGTLLINGIVQEGATLTADISDISDVDGSLTFTYQWQLSNDSSSFDTNSNISGATNSTFTIPSDQSYVDKFIKLTAVSTDARGGTTTFETSPQQVSNIEDEATGTLLINGIVQEGATLTADISDISDVDGSLTFTYQWQLSNDSSSFDTNSNISGATNSTFTIPSDQSYVDKFIKLTAVSTDARGGTTTFETSPQQVSNIEDEATGTLLINGIVQEGATLTADISDISDVDGSLTFTYQWQLSNDSSSFDTNSNISGATNSTFTIPSDQSYVDKFIKLTAVSTDARGGTTTFETSSQQIINVDNEATGTLLINGIVQEGAILTADISDISDVDGSLTFTYQWQLSNDSSSFDTNSNISGATNSTFTIPSDQSYVDKFIRLIAVSTDARGGTTTFETSPQQVSNIEDEATGTLLINGIVQEGATLTADITDISDADGSLTFTYQWQLSNDSSSFDTNSNISGATNSTFTIPSDQSYVDKFIRLIAVSTDARGGTTTFETSPQQVSNIEDEATGTLLINGIVQEGATLTADITDISDADGSLTFTYQWQLSNDSSSFDTNSNISGATNSTFTIPSDQSYVDKFIRLTAVSTDTRGGTTTFETSPQQVSNIDDEATGTLLINGIVQEGATLTADITDISDVDGSLTFTYQWQLSNDSSSFDTNSNISGATNSTFTIPSDQSYVDKFIRLTAVSTDARGGTTTFETSPQQVSNIEDEATGTLLINGIVQEGATLTADITDISDVDGSLTFTYQWQLSNTNSFDTNSNISGATNNTFTIPSDQSYVDKFIRLTAVSTDARGGTTTFETSSQQIINVDNEATGTLLINGIVQEGATLTADITDISDVDGSLTFTYQWQLSNDSSSFDTNSNISGATNSTFTIPSDQSYVDKYIRLTAVSTDARGGTTTFETSSQQIINVEDEATGTLSFDGIVQEGATLTADITDISDVDGSLTFTYQWQLSNTNSFDINSNISGATNNTFTIPSDQSYVDKFIRLTAVSTDARGGTTIFETSSQQVSNIEDEATGTLLINGIVQEGATLTADINNISDVDGSLTFTYQWQLSNTNSFDINSNISGATNSTFTIPSDQSYVDKFIRLTAVSTDIKGGTTLFETSSQQITNIDDEATGTLSFDGIVQEGVTLTADTTDISDVDGSLTFTFQWQLANDSSSFDINSNISGATNSTFTIPFDQSYVDKFIRLTAVSTDARGGKTSFESLSQQVINIDLIPEPTPESEILTQEITIQQGWNWISFYLQPDNLSVSNLNLVDFSGSAMPLLFMKSQSQSTSYYGSVYGWFGNLTEIDITQTYLFKNDSDTIGKISYSGSLVNNVSVDVLVGWNWISYPDSEAKNINEVFANANANDFIKGQGQNQTSQYYQGYGWFGSLNILEPGKGYLYKTNTNNSFLFNQRSIRSIISNNIKIRNFRDFELNVNNYQHNASLNGILTMGSTKITSGILLAYINNEIRGISNSEDGDWQFFSPTGETIIILSIYSNVSSGEVVTFKYYDGNNLYNLESNTNIVFESNAIYGSGFSPIEFSGDELIEIIETTPEPTPEQLVVLTPEPTPEQTPEPTPEQLVVLTPEPTPEQTPEPTPEQLTGLTPEPTPEQTPEPTPEQLTGLTPEPTPETEIESITQSESNSNIVKIVNIYVDSGNFSSPYYRFYTNISGTDELEPINTLYLDTKYVFYRLNDSVNHPFFISDNGYKLSSSSNISISGDGSFNSGIIGNQSFTLEFINFTTNDNLYYYCTSHSNMVGQFSLLNGVINIISEPIQIPEPSPEPVQESNQITIPEPTPIQTPEQVTVPAQTPEQVPAQEATPELVSVSEPSLVPETTQYLLGDINNDGKFTIADMIILKSILDNIPEVENYKTYNNYNSIADINNDGIISNDDIVSGINLLGNNYNTFENENSDALVNLWMEDNKVKFETVNGTRISAIKLKFYNNINLLNVSQTATKDFNVEINLNEIILWTNTNDSISSNLNNTLIELDNNDSFNYLNDEKPEISNQNAELISNDNIILKKLLIWIENNNIMFNTLNNFNLTGFAIQFENEVLLNENIGEIYDKNYNIEVYNNIIIGYSNINNIIESNNSNILFSLLSNNTILNVIDLSNQDAQYINPNKFVQNRNVLVENEPTPEPVEISVSEPTPAQVTVSITEPTPEPVAISVSEPTPAQVTVSITEPTPAQVAVSNTEPTPELVSVSEPISEPTPAQVAVSITEPTPEFVSVSEPISEPTPAQVAVSITEPTPEFVSVSEPISEPTPAQVAVSITEPTPELVSVSEPISEPIPEQEMNFDINVNSYQYNASLNGVLTIGSTKITSGILLAYINDEIRGVSKSEDGDWQFFPPTGETIIILSIYSNVANGEVVTFRYYDGNNLYNLESNTDIIFEPDAIYGSGLSPIEFSSNELIEVIEPIQQPVPEPIQTTVSEPTPAQAAVSIIEPTPEPVSVSEPTPEPVSITQPTPEPAAVSITEPTPAQAAISVSEPTPAQAAISVSEPTPEQTEISVSEPTPEPVSIIEPTPAQAAVSVSEPTPEPVSVSEPTPEPVSVSEPTPEQVAISVSEPTPELVSVSEPTPEPITEPTPAQVAISVSEPTPEPVLVSEPTPEPTQEQEEMVFDINVNSYQYNASLNGVLTIGSTKITSGILLAYINDELRGISNSEDGDWQLFPPTGETIIILSIYSNVANGEVVTFKYYDGNNLYNLQSNTDIIFESDAIYGSGLSPIEFSGNELAEVVESISQSVPEPTQTIATEPTPEPNSISELTPEQVSVSEPTPEQVSVSEPTPEQVSVSEPHLNKFQ